MLAVLIASAMSASSPAYTAANANRRALARRVFVAAKLDEEVKTNVRRAVDSIISPTYNAIIDRSRPLKDTFELRNSFRAASEKVEPEIVDEVASVMPGEMTKSNMNAALTYLQSPSAKAIAGALNKASMAGIAGMFARMPIMLGNAVKDYCVRVTCTAADQGRFAAIESLFGGNEQSANAPPPLMPAELKRLSLAKTFFCITHADVALKAALDRRVAEALLNIGNSGGASPWTFQDSFTLEMKSFGSNLMDDEIAEFAKVASPEDVKSGLAFYRSSAGMALLAATNAVDAATNVLLARKMRIIYAVAEADYCAKTVCTHADHDKFKTILQNSNFRDD